MKRILFLFAAAITATTVYAQDDLLQFFPNQKGAQLINKTYDANNNLLCTTTMTVQNYYQYADGSDIQLRSVTTDALGRQIDSGNIEAYYQGGNFFLKMSNYAARTSDVVNYLSAQNEMIADFVDYPNPMGNDNPMDWNPVFAMDEGNLTVRSKSDKKDFVRVRDYNRQYLGSEQITTPAGTFHAYKINYNVEVTTNGMRKNLRGVEWYAPGAGIVRSEIYDGGRLQNYTVLASLTK